MHSAENLKGTFPCSWISVASLSIARWGDTLMTEPMAHWGKELASAVTPKMPAGKDVPRKHGDAQSVTRSPSRNWSARQSGWLACNVTDLFVLVSTSVGSKMTHVTVNGRGRTNNLNLSKSWYTMGLRVRFDSATDKSGEIKQKGGSVGKKKLRLKRFILRLPVLQLYNSQVKSNLYRQYVERKNFIWYRGQFLTFTLTFLFLPSSSVNAKLPSLSCLNGLKT